MVRVGLQPTSGVTGFCKLGKWSWEWTQLMDFHQEENFPKQGLWSGIENVVIENTCILNQDRI